MPSHWRFPRQLDDSDLLVADLIIAVKETEHRPLLENRFYGWKGNVAFWHIHDLDCAPAEEALAQLQDRVDRLFNNLVMMVHLSTLGTGQISCSVAETDVGSNGYQSLLDRSESDAGIEGVLAT
jgi:hypothetical protein